MKLKSVKPFEKYNCYLVLDKKRNRKIVVVRRDGRKKTISFAKWIMMAKLKRKLEKNETVRRIDKKLKEDRIFNLKIVKCHGDNKNSIGRTIIVIKCAVCSKKFWMEKTSFNSNLNKKAPISCSKECGLKLRALSLEAKIELKNKQIILKECRDWEREQVNKLENNTARNNLVQNNLNNNLGNIHFNTKNKNPALQEA